MKKRIALVTLILALTAGCATSTPGSSDHPDGVTTALERLGVTRGEPVRNIQSFRINGWQAVDDTHIVLTAGVHDHYLLTLAQPCRELRSAFGITFDTHMPSLSRMDSVVVNAFHGPLEKCSILEITRLNHLEDQK